MTIDQPDLSGLAFGPDGLLPAIVQDATSGRVRMLGYMNRAAVELTVQSGRLHFWSRSRNALWMKGESSGNVHHVLAVHSDCDGDALLVQVRTDGPTCHLGTESCFDNAPIVGPAPIPASSRVVDEVAEVIATRHSRPIDGSYTTYLLNQGIDKIGKKIGEEAAEVIIAAKNGEAGALANEAADLVYHLLVMLEVTGVARDEVWSVLSTRRGRPPSDQPQ